ncbi:Response regulator [Sulfidibacter corallicola]|uniref:Response regulator n=1 Tax=Sulfidibacter corallicola TaxID=2818388 RepID=A0A8A4TQF0_SULCO|nr:response regulator [Sulfidibacter corallicola]QTD51312.1 response regulator [Sulfidibacter corallicola]
MRTLLIEDEDGARAYLRGLLEGHDDVAVVGEAENGLKAIEAVNRLEPDLIFLDVQMPVLNGFEILGYFKHHPMIVFCTAFDEYAIKAFEVNALDYLLKPVDPHRLSQCLEKIRQECRKRDSLQALALEPDRTRNLVCRRGQSYHLVWLREVCMIFKDGRYTAVRTSEGGQYFLDLTIDQVDGKICNDHFFRINRATIMRREAVRRFGALPNGNGELETEWGESLSISRGRLAEFRRWFQGEAVE